jgi:hypothetical protein
VMCSCAAVMLHLVIPCKYERDTDVNEYKIMTT